MVSTGSSMVPGALTIYASVGAHPSIGGEEYVDLTLQGVPVLWGLEMER